MDRKADKGEIEIDVAIETTAAERAHLGSSGERAKLKRKDGRAAARRNQHSLAEFDFGFEEQSKERDSTGKDTDKDTGNDTSTGK